MEKKTRLIIFIALFLISLPVNALPPLMTSFQENLNISIANSSMLPISNTLGTVIFAFLGGILIAQTGLRKTLLIAIFFSFMGNLLVASSRNLFLIILAFFVVGIGEGLSIISLTTFFAHLDDKLQKYGLFHSIFGLGGIITPFIIGVFLKQKISYRYLFLLFSLANVLLWFCLNRFHGISEKKYSPIRLTEGLSILKKPYVYIPITLFFIYSASERGTILWSNNLFTGSFDYTKEKASFILSAFWILFTLGRVFSDVLISKKPIRQIITLSAIFSLLSLLLLIALKSYLFFILLAIFLAPVYPAIQGFLLKKVSKREIGMINGMTFCITSLGVAFGSFVMGFIGNKNILLSYIFPIVCFFLIVIFANSKVFK